GADTLGVPAFTSADVKAGTPNVSAPVYSHIAYDIVPGESVVVDRPDVLIVEGLNVLQPAVLPTDGEAIPFVSDYFDFSIYIHADVQTIGRWYQERFMRLRTTAFRQPGAYFRRYADLSDAQARETAASIWQSINLVNLSENILPTRQRADLILTKGEDHLVETVQLRKL
ncbi:MAG: type I pantothenate kinase, partial [Pseudomonadota bacterium]